MSDPQVPQQNAAVVTKTGGSACIQPSSGSHNALSPLEQGVATTSATTTPTLRQPGTSGIQNRSPGSTATSRGVSTTQLVTPRVLSPAAAAAASSAVIGQIGGGGRVVVVGTQATSSLGMGAPAVTTKTAAAPAASVYGSSSSTTSSPASQRRVTLPSTTMRESLASVPVSIGVHRTVPSSVTKATVFPPAGQRTVGDDPQPRKKMRLEGDGSGESGGRSGSGEGTGEVKLEGGEEALKRLVVDYRCGQLKSVRDSYHEHVAELFFLQNGGNMMDYPMWRKRPPQLFAQFLRGNHLDSSDEEDLSVGTPNPNKIALVVGQGTVPGSTSGSVLAAPGSVAAVPAGPVTSAVTHHGASHQKVPTPMGSRQGAVPSSSPAVGIVITPKPALENMRPSTASTMLLPKQPQTSLVTSHPSSTPISSTLSRASTSLAPSHPHYHHRHSSAVTTSPQSSAPKPVLVTAMRQSISSVYDTSIGSQEQIVERAKQEAFVVQRIAELQKDGLWSERRLPKVQEPPRTKAHWDYLLEEMVWLAADFAQERKWKKSAAKKVLQMGS